MDTASVGCTPTNQRGIMAKTQKIRVNINVTEEQKEKMLQLSSNLQMSLTEYIITQCLHPVTQDQHDSVAMLEALRERIRMQQEVIDRQEMDIDMWKQNYTSAFNMAQMGMWHSLPFWKKLFTKVKELPNK